MQNTIEQLADTLKTTGLGYVLVGGLAFAIGVILTSVCLRIRKKTERNK